MTPFVGWAARAIRKRRASQRSLGDWVATRRADRAARAGSFGVWVDRRRAERAAENYHTWVTRRREARVRKVNRAVNRAVNHPVRERSLILRVVVWGNVFVIFGVWGAGVLSHKADVPGVPGIAYQQQCGGGVWDAKPAAWLETGGARFVPADWPPKWSKSPWRVPGWLWGHRNGKLGDYSPLPTTFAGAAALVFTVEAAVLKMLMPSGGRFGKVSTDGIRQAAGLDCCTTTTSQPPVTGVPAAYTTGATLTAAQVAGYARAGGFPETQIPTAVAVAKAESGWNPTVRNSIGASGLWQILQSAHPELFTRYDWRDPAQNAVMAFSVWERAGQSWKPWEAFTNRSYLRFMEPTAPTTPPAAGCAPTTTGASFPTGAAGDAIRFAEAQLGEPYVFGSEGPDSWDCSSLMQAAWAAAGVSIPRTASAQYTASTHIPVSSVVPGSLVFAQPGVRGVFGHVGMVIDGGRVIEAPHTGDVVKIIPLSSYRPVAAGNVK